ncbi:MAG: hypothetical protein ACOVQA_04785 [Thermoflexibacteraceae bacterium]|jgi:Uri superfamily endonuclease
MENSSEKELLQTLLQEVKALRQEVYQLHTQNQWIIDHLNPTYSNVRNIHLVTHETEKKVDRILARMK